MSFWHVLYVTLLSFVFLALSFNSISIMYRRDIEAFKNPTHLVRPLTVDPNRRIQRSLKNEVKVNKTRPKTAGLETSKAFTDDFQSSSTSTNFSFVSDYDTDFEDDTPVNDNDDACIEMYKRTCKIEKIVPIKQYLNNYKRNEFSLRFYGLGPKGLRAFIPSLTLNQYIRKLDLASNGLGDEGVFYLANILRDNVALKDINLSQNFIGIDGVRELCELFKESHIAINHLTLEGNLLDDECARLFSEVISTNEHFYTLNLAKNKFGSASGIYFGQALVENESIESLDLSWNTINGKGAVALIKGIQKNKCLQILNLAHNGLSGGECGRAWLHVFKENTTLIKLDLSHNRLSAEPATSIGRGLAKSENLETINLTGNPLESAGCYAILKPLIAKNAVPNKLELIDLTEILVNRDFHDLFLQVKEKRSELRVLIGLKTPPSLLKDDRPPVSSPIERLQTLFRRRPQLDLTSFFYSVATGNETLDNHSIDHDRLKQAIREKLNAQFSDADIEQIIKEIAQFDCKQFIQTFDNKSTPASLSASSWRFRSS